MGESKKEVVRVQFNPSVKLNSKAQKYQVMAVYYFSERWMK